jgi:hypothetical protein
MSASVPEGRPTRPAEPAESAPPGSSPVEPSALEELAREQTTARVALTQERQDALDRQARFAGWFMLFGVGPAALVAVILALLTDRPDLVWPFFGLGIGVQIWRIWKEQRHIARLERELEDPIDGS